MNGNNSDTENSRDYINNAHQWMSENILHGRAPVLYGFLVAVEHSIPAGTIWENLARWTGQYLSNGRNRTEEFHAIFDRELEALVTDDIKSGYRPPFCFKGCSECCYQHVACTDEEAQLIHNFCSSHGIAIDYEKMLRQLDYLEFDKEGNFNGQSSWSAQSESDQACPFLDMDEGTCTIWPVRPFVCRSTLAEVTCDYCRPYNGMPSPESKAILHPETSYILSAVFTVHHDSIGKTMAKLLLDLRAKQIQTN